MHAQRLAVLVLLDPEIRSNLANLTTPDRLQAASDYLAGSHAYAPNVGRRTTRRDPTPTKPLDDNHVDVILEDQCFYVEIRQPSRGGRTVG